MIDFMGYAVRLAKKCKKNEDVPVGAVVVCNGKIVGIGYNQKNKKQNSLMHAEIIALFKASKKIKNFRLNDCDIYITKEPCIMCMGAILSCRIHKIIYGAKDNKYSSIDLAYNNNFNHKCEVEQDNNYKPICAKLLTDFFENLRSKKNAGTITKNQRETKK